MLFLAAYPDNYPVLAVLERFMTNLYDTAADYEARANQHRPTDPEQWVREVDRLQSQSLTLRDIAAALRIDAEQIRALKGGAR
jgi:hypothetical protein